MDVNSWRFGNHCGDDQYLYFCTDRQLFGLPQTGA